MATDAVSMFSSASLRGPASELAGQISWFFAAYNLDQGIAVFFEEQFLKMLRHLLAPTAGFAPPEEPRRECVQFLERRRRCAIRFASQAQSGQRCAHHIDRIFDQILVTNNVRPAGPFNPGAYVSAPTTELL